MLLDPETLDRLRHYEALLHKWQKAVNLVGPSTLPDSWSRHFDDSLQLLPLLPPPLDGHGERLRLYDLGSGAGFPGLVIAVARPDIAVTLIESDQKKCAFLTSVSHETKTPVRILSHRIEAATGTLPAPDAITARALAPLSALLRYIQPWVEKNPDLVCIFPKGAQAQAEIEAARATADFEATLHESVTEKDARVIVLQRVKF